MTTAPGITSIPSVADLLGPTYSPEYQEAFPDVAPPYLPFGYLLLVQLRMPKKKVGSIIVPDTEHDAERYRVQSALVRALGPAAYTDRQTGKPWVEGSWVQPGDFVRAPMFGGDRFDVTPRGSKDKTTFVFVRDADIIARVIGDPLNVATS